MSQIDWESLRTTALEVMARAYAPYSNYRVGAAALVDDGRVVSGCNVENAAYGVVLCAGSLYLIGEMRALLRREKEFEDVV